jgi:glucose-6-phosphate dehydrogenase assembly protein OpcA
VSPTSDSVWSAQDTNPGAIDAALREMLAERHAESDAYVPARVLNLVCVVDRQWSGEIANRLRQVGRYHPSRTIVCEVEPGRTRLDARAMLATDAEPGAGELAEVRETVIVEVGERHLPHLDTIVDPLVVTDLSTVVWAPHGQHEAVDAILHLVQVVLLDSVDEPELGEALARAHSLSERAYVVDLAWLRSTPWRERIAATFDPPDQLPQLRRISALHIRHHPDSGIAGLLLAGWLASRLGWRPSKLIDAGKGLSGRLRGARGDVAVELTPTPQQVRGLAGITIETAAGTSISLDRGAGGLHAVRRGRDGSVQEWTALGASRGEAGILGEGIRQALLRDPTYQPALGAACAMVP